MYNANNSAITPKPPTPAPTAIPALTPGVRSPLDAGGVSLAGGSDVVGMGAGVEGAAAGLEVAVEVVEATLTVHPTTAIAPTDELLDRVVVLIFHASDSPKGVDAYVRVIPEGTSDRQSPATLPEVVPAK